MQFRSGDRVRIKNPSNEYTGCRGTIVVDAADQPSGVLALGHFVAIDGENGRTRPFLIADLEPLRVARVRSNSASRDASPRDRLGDAKNPTTGD
jgi:hypothetical protein